MPVTDTPNLRPYQLNALPVMDESLRPFVIAELKKVSASLNATIVALKSIEARIVVGGL